jgi:hypothetical protein
MGAATGRGERRDKASGSPKARYRPPQSKISPRSHEVVRSEPKLTCPVPAFAADALKPQEPRKEKLQWNENAPGLPNNKEKLAAALLHSQKRYQTICRKVSNCFGEVDSFVRFSRCQIVLTNSFLNSLVPEIVFVWFSSCQIILPTSFLNSLVPQVVSQTVRYLIQFARNRYANCVQPQTL